MTGTTIDASAIDEAFVPTPVAGIAGVEIDGESVLTTPAHGDVRRIDAHVLDRTATMLWSMFDGTTPLGALIDDVEAVTGTDRNVIRDDVVGATATMGRAGLLRGVAAERPASLGSIRPDAVPVGTPVPPFVVIDPDGRQLDNRALLGTTSLLINWSQSCRHCVTLADTLAAETARLTAAGIDVVVCAPFHGPGSDELVGADWATRVFLVRDGFELFADLGTPAAYLVDPGGRVASDLALGSDLVTRLIDHVAPPPDDH